MRSWYLSLSGGAFASKLLGALREILLARWFGTGYVADSYRASLTAVLSPVHLISSRLVQTCFIPLYAGYRRDQPERGRALFTLLLLLFTAFGALLGLALWLFAEPLVRVLLPGFGPERHALTEAMLRIMAPGVPFYIYTVLLGALGAAQEDYLIPSLRPGLQNFGMLVLIASAALTGRPELAAYGFTGSYLFLAVLASGLVWRRNEFPSGARPDRALLQEVGGAIWILFRPLLLVSILVEAQVLLERYLASLIGPGSVASMEYARFFTETSHTLLIVPLGFIGLSYFSAMAPADLHSKVDRHLARIFLIFLPLSAFLCMNGEALLRIVYLRGAFDLNSLAMTHRALLGLASGLWLYSGSFFLQRVFNARLDNRKVLRGEALFTLISIAFMLLSYRSLGLLGLGLAPALGAAASLAYYWRRLDTPLSLARRSITRQLLMLPAYLAGAWLLQRWQTGWIGLALQVVLALGLWGVWVLRSDLGFLLRNRAGGGGRGE